MLWYFQTSVLLWFNLAPNISLDMIWKLCQSLLSLVFKKSYVISVSCDCVAYCLYSHIILTSLLTGSIDDEISVAGNLKPGAKQNTTLTLSTFSWVRTDARRPGGFLFITDPAVLNVSAHLRIMLRSEMSWTLHIKLSKKTAITDPALVKKISMTNIRSPQVNSTIATGCWNCIMYTVC